jgi:two-component sensor histidine kinase
VNEIALSGDALARVAPFHLRLGAGGEAGALSPALARYWGLSAAPGLDELRARRPFAGPLRAAWLPELTGIALDLEPAAGGPVLRAELVHLDGGGWLFVGSPMARRADELDRAGLLLSDLPAHLWVGDLLIALEAAQVAQVASERATASLLEHRDALQRAVLEQATLLQEVHHRVKNNLQIIASLLRMQAAALPGREARRPFDDSVQRVLAIAALHEHLYGQPSLAEVDLGAYCDSLIRPLRASVAPGAQIELRAAPVRATPEVALPFGLIVNELVTNALKYGLRAPSSPPGPDLRVTLALRAGGFSLRVSDAGPGLPPGFDLRSRERLGLVLVQRLVGQLRGRLSVDGGGPGAAFTLEVPADGAEDAGGAQG